MCYVLIREYRGTHHENRRTHIEPRGLGNHPADGGQACARRRVTERGDEELRPLSHDDLSLAARAQEGRREAALQSRPSTGRPPMIVATSGQRQKVSAISAVNATGAF